jgi:hypothetical protein
VRTTLAANGIEAQLAQDPDLPTGAVVALRGDESVSVIADRGANARLSLADVPDPLEGSTVLVSGFALFQSGSAPAARAALEGFTLGRRVDLATAGLAAADSFLRPPSSLAPPRESPNWPPSRFLACGVLGWEFVQP